MNLALVCKKPHLIWLWISQLLSVIGDHLFTVALTWVAVKQVGSSAALVTAAGTATALLFGLLGGALADRWNRRRVMVRVDVLRAVCVGTLPWLLRGGELKLWTVVCIVVLVEALGTLFNPALQASLPELCEDIQALQATNVLLDGTHRLARVLGPGLTGVFLLVFALPQFFAFDAWTFVISAVVLMLLKAHFAKRVPDRGEVTGGLSLLGEIGISLRLLREHRTLRWALASLGIVNVAWSAVYATGIPLLAAQQLTGGIGSYGLIVGAYGVGNVVSLLVLGWLPFRMNIVLMFAGEVLLGIGFLQVSFATTLSMAMAATALAAFGSPIGDLIMLAMIQTDFPAAHIGKMYSLRQFLSGTGLLFGSLLAVPLFKWCTISAAMQLFSALILLVGVAGVIRFTLYGKFVYPSRSK